MQSCSTGDSGQAGCKKGERQDRGNKTGGMQESRVRGMQDMRDADGESRTGGIKERGDERKE